MNFTLKIWRQRDAHSKGEFKEYKVSNISSDTSFLEMLDILNNDLVHKGENEAPELTKEDLTYEFTHRAQRNYKD